jgi:hypothetical protein
MLELSKISPASSEKPLRELWMLKHIPCQAQTNSKRKTRCAQQ